jgi:hypothetical protein
MVRASPTRSGSTEQRGGAAAYPLLVGVRDDEHPVVVEQVLDEHDLAGALEAHRSDDIEGLVEHHLTARRDQLHGHAGAQRDAHLATRGEDVDRPVARRIDHHAIGVRWLGEPVDLGLEGDDLRAGVLESAHQTLVLRRQSGQRGLQRRQSMLEFADAQRVEARLTTQLSHLGAQQLDLVGHRVHLLDRLAAVGTVPLDRLVGHQGLLDLVPRP